MPLGHRLKKKNTIIAFDEFILYARVIFTEREFKLFTFLRRYLRQTLMYVFFIFIYVLVLVYWLVNSLHMCTFIQKIITLCRYQTLDFRRGLYKTYFSISVLNSIITYTRVYKCIGILFIMFLNYCYSCSLLVCFFII